MAYTRAQVRDLIRQRCDLENTSVQLNAELNNHINDSAKVVHDFLIATLGERYAIEVEAVATAAGTANYALASADFYRPVSIRLAIDDLSFPLSSGSLHDMVGVTVGAPWGLGDLPQFTITQQIDGSFELGFNPPPDSVYSIVVFYHPTAPEYTDDADPIGLPFPDLLIMEACIRVKDKEERDASRFMQERELIKKRIEDWVGSMDMSGPAQTMWMPRYGRQFRRSGRIF